MPKKTKKQRGRPEERLVISPKDAGKTLDGWLGKRPGREADQRSITPTVRSKRPKLR